jgi:hypothetical protein
VILETSSPPKINKGGAAANINVGAVPGIGVGAIPGASEDNVPSIFVGTILNSRNPLWTLGSVGHRNLSDVCKDSILSNPSNSFSG